MPLTRGEALGYDADLMAFKFTMKNGEQVVQCQISHAALGDLADRWRGAGRELRAEFEAHRELIEAITSEQFDQISNKETRLVRIFAKHIGAHLAQRGRGPFSRARHSAELSASTDLGRKLVHAANARKDRWL